MGDSPCFLTSILETLGWETTGPAIYEIEWSSEPPVGKASTMTGSVWAAFGSSGISKTRLSLSLVAIVETALIRSKGLADGIISAFVSILLDFSKPTG